MDTSPSKRHVLAPIDANSKTTPIASKPQASKPRALSALLSPDGGAAVKRPLDQEVVHHHARSPLGQSVKRRRISAEEPVRYSNLDGERGSQTDLRSKGGVDFDDSSNTRDGDDVERERSTSPEEDSSLLDNSAVDITQDTTMTEPDAEVAAPTPAVPTRPSTMTREEARRKAETLRLRLGLAGYKVRTGQTDVTLEQLEARSLLGSRRREQPSLPPLPRHTGAHEGAGGEKTVEDGRQGRPSAGTPRRKALPVAPTLSLRDSFGTRRVAPSLNHPRGRPRSA